MKINKLFFLVGIAAMLSFLASCAGEGTQTGQEQDGQNAAASATAEPVDPVAWNDLQSLIPAKAAGLKKTNADDDKSSLGNLGFSHALGIYEEGDKKVEIQIIDSGNRSVILTTLAPWRNMTSLNMQDDAGTGYEKYVTIEENPGYEAFTKVDNTAKLNTLVKGRFVVMLTGKNVPVDDLYKVMKDLGLDKMASM
jgi:hypothetical protein